MRMRLKRMVIAGLLGAALTIGAATPARALTQGEEAGFSLLAAVANLFYTPAKTVVAVVGLPVGAFTGWVSGGEERSAYAIWVPTSGGDYFLTTDHMEGSKPIRFFGHDYADTPATMEYSADGTYDDQQNGYDVSR
jgi:hypothetical protein